MRVKTNVDKILRNRLYCLRFFAVVKYGSGQSTRRVNGKHVWYKKSVPPHFDRHLGYPDVDDLCTASKKVRAVCKDLVNEYYDAQWDWHEAQIRWHAARHWKTWRWYTCGTGNRSSVAYRSKVAEVKNSELNTYHKYKYAELLPRKEERARAYGEMQAAVERMMLLQNQIFSKMGVPEEYRGYKVGKDEPGLRDFRKPITRREKDSR